MEDAVEVEKHKSSNKKDMDSKLQQIRSSPKLQSQQHTASVLNAVEDTLRSQNSEFTPTAYFAALLSVLGSSVSTTQGILNKDIATAVVYLLDLITPHVPIPLLRSKFTSILSSLAPSLNTKNVEAPFIRSAIGCLVSLLVAQDSQAWALSSNQDSPRKAVTGLLSLAMDPRPKVRKRAQEGLVKILQNGPPSPSIDHPAADMCAETALLSFQTAAKESPATNRKSAGNKHQAYDPHLIHSMQFVGIISSACGGWPIRSLDTLCETLFSVAKSRSEMLTINAFNVFETILNGMANEKSISRLPQLLKAIKELQPSEKDSQLLPPWLAVISRGQDISAQIEPIETFQTLPDIFETISPLVASASYEIRVSASECLISLLVNCIPDSIIIESSIYDQKTFERLSNCINDLLTVKYQSSWMEVFSILSAAFDSFKWQSYPSLAKVVAVIGELRAQESFTGKSQADQVISKAITAMGPEALLEILPLNLASSTPGTQGRAWLIPLLRDSVQNTNLSHFKQDLLPLSEKLYEKITGLSQEQKTMESKIFETLIQQIWSIFPGYCDRALDVPQSFDQSFAELLCNVMYQQTDMRLTICKGLQNLVDTNEMIQESEENLILQGRITKSEAAKNLQHLSSFAPNLLAVLFNIYTETLPQQRGNIFACIDSYLKITGNQEVSEIFDRITTLLNSTIQEFQPATPNSDQTKHQSTANALMDIVVTIAIYLPRESFQSLFHIASIIISQKQFPQLQKKAYKLIPRLAQSSAGKEALQQRNHELRQIILQNADKVMAPARRDRISAVNTIAHNLPSSDLQFIAEILPEIILSTKETNERTRESAFDLLVFMGERMQQGGTIQSAEGINSTASLEEYLTMLSAGLAGTSPHMISATITAISRILFHFHSSLSESTITDLLQTMDLFLKSPAREVVRSVLGFVKVCVISLPANLMKSRLSTLIPNLMNWSHEQKGRLRVKIKNILERMIRHYGVEIVERNCPSEDRKLITNVRKTRERRKRKKTDSGADADAMDEDQPENEEPASRYSNEFDEAIYGSDSGSEGSEPEEEGVSFKDRNTKTGRKSGKRQNETYIHEDEEEPLDLLDRKSLSHVSSTKPFKSRPDPRRRIGKNSKVDPEGKLLFDEDDDDEPDENTTLEGGINAYVDAIKSRHAPRKGQRGRLKFSNSRNDEMDVDQDGSKSQPIHGRRPISGRGGIHKAGGRGRGGERGGMRGGRGGRMGHMAQRRGLGGVRGAKIQKQRGFAGPKRRGK